MGKRILKEINFKKDICISIFLRILVIGLIGFTEYVLIYFAHSPKVEFQWTTAITILISGILAGVILTNFKIIAPIWLTLLTPVVAMPISAVIMVVLNGFLFGFKDMWSSFFGIMIVQNLMFIMAPYISIPILGIAYVGFKLINKIV